MRGFSLKKAGMLLAVIFLAVAAATTMPEEKTVSAKYESVEGTKIRIVTNTANVVVTLNGSRAAADLVALLPVQTTLVERMGFAKSISLPAQLSSSEPTTWNYEVGNLNYWNAGPSVSMPYNHKFDKTAVAVIPLGRADDPVEAEKLSGSEGLVRIELAELKAK